MKYNIDMGGLTTEITNINNGVIKIECRDIEMPYHKHQYIKTPNNELSIEIPEPIFKALIEQYLQSCSVYELGKNIKDIQEILDESNPFKQTKQVD